MPDLDKEAELEALYSCVQKDGSFRKEIESSSVFLTGLRHYTEYVAQQPNGKWEGFDCKPVLTASGWDYQGDRPESLTVEGSLSVSWDKTLCKHERYQVKLQRDRKTFRVKGM